MRSGRVIDGLGWSCISICCVAALRSKLASERPSSSVAFPLATRQLKGDKRHDRDHDEEDEELGVGYACVRISRRCPFLRTYFARKYARIRGVALHRSRPTPA